MKTLLLFSILAVTLFTQSSFGQKVKFKKSDLFGEWSEIEKTKDGYLYYSPCDGKASKIIISKHSIVFIYQIEEPDSLLVMYIQERPDSTLLVKGIAENNRTMFFRISWVNKRNGISLWEISADKPLENEGFKMFMCVSSKKTKFRIEENPCPENKVPEKQLMVN